MARVAFYAPMKSPGSQKPSGDREMARNLMLALAAQGNKVELASDLRVYDKNGDRDLQRTLVRAAEIEAQRLSAELPFDTDLWVTYHNYYKAPDLLGPKVCQARGIPYVQLESTRASSRLNGPWADFAQAAHQACDAADIIFYHTANDLISLERDRLGKQALVELPPFLPETVLPVATTGDGPMLTVGMMRHGDKLASYRILAEALSHLTCDWNLNIAGDGPARPDVEALMVPFGSRVHFLGQLDRATLQKIYQRASLLVWPGVNEAYGMVYLEAQATGLPVIAQDRPGVRDVLAPAVYPTVEAGARGLADHMQNLLEDTAQRHALGANTRSYVARRHLMPQATERLWAHLRPLLKDVS
ncbi:glycosyltransferase family 4 protein [Ruegeria sp. HKCCSP351]|uniref:glycosyltransferase family 4 protein n=1 Tax=Ruegeria sp. HKCCSP351 TaxID=2794832 RepID=UPI001AE29C71|nr:glycosyltransferase family 4 protein [Ruegeria sp. HKCCSP351]